MPVWLDVKASIHGYCASIMLPRYHRGGCLPVTAQAHAFRHLILFIGCATIYFNRMTEVSETHVSVTCVSSSVNSFLVLYHVQCLHFHASLNILSSAWFLVCFWLFQATEFFHFTAYAWRCSKHLGASFFFYHNAKESLFQSKITRTQYFF